MEDHFFSEQLLKVEILSEILSTFSWPEAYQIIDELPDCIKLTFPKCTLLFIEGFNHEVFVKLDNEQTNTPYSLDLNSVLHYIFIPEAKKEPNFSEPKLICDFSIPGTLTKLRHQIMDTCMLLQTYFLPCIKGDFSWVEKYQEVVK